MGFFQNIRRALVKDNFRVEIKALESIGDKRTPKEDIRLAFAYIRQAAQCESSQERSDSVNKSLKLYLKHEKEFYTDIMWSFHGGVCYFLLGEELRALPYFHNVLVHCPDDMANRNFLLDTQSFIKDATEKASAFLYAGTFLEHTKKAWSDFRKQEAKLRELLSVSDHDKWDEAQSIFYRIINPVVKNIVANVYCKDGRYIIELQNDLSVIRLCQLDYFARHMPKELKKNWQVLLGKVPAKDSPMTLMLVNESIEAKDISCFAHKLTNGQYDLSVYEPRLKTAMSSDPQKVNNIVSYAVTNVLGEMLTLSSIAHINIALEPFDEPSCTLDKLYDFLLLKIESPHISLAQVLTQNETSYSYKSFQTKDDDHGHSQGLEHGNEQGQGYELEEAQGEVQSEVQGEANELLQNTVTGKTYLRDLLSSYLDHDDSNLYELTDNGAVAVSVYFEWPEGQALSEELLLNLQKTLKQEDSKGGYMTAIGQAQDLNCGYLDFIAWDLPLCLPVWRRVFKRYHLRKVHYQVYSAFTYSVDLFSGEITKKKLAK